MRIVGTVLLIISCILLGLSAEHLDKSGVSLVSEHEIYFGGIYD